jgi:hypothetical protein
MTPGKRVRTTEIRVKFPFVSLIPWTSAYASLLITTRPSGRVSTGSQPFSM